jgi:hypothetical protein
MIERGRGFNELPELILDHYTGIITIEGNSVPEDASEVWKSFAKQIERFIIKHKKVLINFKLGIFNTSSSLYINSLFSFIEKLSKDFVIKVNWYYLEIDEDNLEIGEEYQSRFNIDFNLIKI